MCGLGVGDGVGCGVCFCDGCVVEVLLIRGVCEFCECCGECEGVVGCDCCF